MADSIQLPLDDETTEYVHHNPSYMLRSIKIAASDCYNSKLTREELAVILVEIAGKLTARKPRQFTLDEVHDHMENLRKKNKR